MKVVFALSALVLSAASQAQTAEPAAKLAEKNACMACHQVDKKSVGPAYAEVAKKYAADKDAVNNLVKNIKAGGAGKWGPVPMPAQTALSEADAKAIATWIVGMAKK